MTLSPARADNRSSTRLDHEDADLRGRTYAIPFDRVWTAAVQLAGGGLSRWRLVRNDDGPGVIQVEVRPRLWGEPADILIRVGLDDDAQTRVDMVSSTRGQGRDWGASRRRIVRFFEALDRALSPSPGQVLPPVTVSATDG